MWHFFTQTTMIRTNTTTATVISKNLSSMHCQYRYNYRLKYVHCISVYLGIHYVQKNQLQ
jgi:hypothetical protein